MGPVKYNLKASTNYLKLYIEAVVESENSFFSVAPAPDKGAVQGQPPPGYGMQGMFICARTMIYLKDTTWTGISGQCFRGFFQTTFCFAVAIINQLPHVENIYMAYVNC